MLRLFKLFIIIPCMHSYIVDHRILHRNLLLPKKICSMTNHNKRTGAEQRRFDRLRMTTVAENSPCLSLAGPVTAASIESRLNMLRENDDYCFDTVCHELDEMKTMNQLRLWRSVQPSFRRTTLGEVKMLTRGIIKEGTLDINGDDDMQTISVSFYSTLLSSMALSLLAGCVIPDIDLPFM